jgi:RNA polymerase sigma-70 factor (family 1)
MPFAISSPAMEASPESLSQTRYRSGFQAARHREKPDQNKLAPALSTQARLPGSACFHYKQPVVEKKLYTDEEALQALLEGREQGLDHFFNCYYSPLTYFVLKLTGDQQLAEDITSEAFVKLWHRREELSGEGSLKAYLYRMVRNAAIDHMRMQKRTSAALTGLVQTSHESEAPVLHRMIESEMLDQVYRSLQHLPPKCSQVFRMFYLQGKSYAEIADELGLSPHTVRNQKARALRLLKTKLSYFSYFAALLLVF